MGADVARCASARRPRPGTRRRGRRAACCPDSGKLDDNVHGLGFMAEVGALAETAYWMEWWQRAPDGNFDRDYSHQLDATRDDFYDYSVKGYMTAAPRHRRAVAPWVPTSTTAASTTASSRSPCPSRPEARSSGSWPPTSASPCWSGRVLPWLARADGMCVLLNTESRVLVSNSVRYNVGDVVPG